jgi:HEPN domain-containing protein
VISIADLLAIAEARLKDANVLLANDRTDSAVYICGYVVELALKARICKTLNWRGFPETRSEFEHFASFKTHRLNILLTLSGQELRIKTDHLTDWSSVESWYPEMRYRTVGQADPVKVAVMLTSAENLLEVL